MPILSKLLAPLVAALFFFPFLASAQIDIRYATDNVPDEALGADLWRYSYHVSGSFNQFYSFEILFGAHNVTSLEVAPVSPSTEWFVSTVQPLPGIPADGLFSGMALAASANASTVFDVAFVWAGPGVPGAQAFNILDDQFGLIASGTTAPIPEPGIYGLLGAGLIVVWLRSRRQSASCPRG